MSEDLNNLIFFAAILPIGIISAVRPKWTFFVLTYGRPERVNATGVKFFRFCAA